jgi:sugar (pentulose or hexulose) kinase
MNKLVLVALTVGVLAVSTMAQDAGNQAVRGVGTVNQMSATPDQNQRLTGQQPLTNTGGPSADAPDNTDRVNGRAYPVGSGAADGPQAVQNALDPRSGRPASDAARLEAAKQAQAGAARPPLDPSRAPEKTVTPAPGANAKTKASTGGQTNDVRKKK